MSTTPDEDTRVRWIAMDRCVAHLVDAILREGGLPHLRMVDAWWTTESVRPSFVRLVCTTGPWVLLTYTGQSTQTCIPLDPSITTFEDATHAALAINALLS